MKPLFRVTLFSAALVLVLPALADDDKPDYKVVPVNRLPAKIWRYSNQVITIQVGKQNIEIHPMEDAKVYTANPPAGFDDKGNLKKYTRSELAKMKGKNPGFASDFDALAAGKVVQISVVRKVPTKKLAKGETDPNANKLYYDWVLVIQ